MKSPQQLSNIVALAALVAITALLHVTATPFAYNPYMTNEYATSTLSHKSPAFGAVCPDLDKAYMTYVEFAYPVATDDSTVQAEQVSGSTTLGNSTDQTGGTPSSYNPPEQGTAQGRKLEVTTNTDIQKVETFFGASLEMNVKKLNPNAAYYVMPRPSSYWATYQDGINYRWSPGNPSASEKYATAFGLDSTAFTEKVSEATGILSMKKRKACFSDAECASQNDGSKCAIRGGDQQGYCIPTWFGICHAWSPAALLEPEPRCAVEENGVTFQPKDIKALLTQVYDDGDVGTIFTGVRFDGSDSTATKDKYGRYTDSSRRDLGPGYMHVALANIIRRFNSSVVMDVTGGAQVWNQPIYSYEVVSQTELNPSEAANQYYNQNVYPFNREAQRIMYTETKVTWMVKSLEDGALVSTGLAGRYAHSDTYTYLLELDNDYNILGGEWVGDSNDDHPDFLWIPKSRPAEDRVTEVGLSYKNVRELLDKATSCA